MNFFTKVILGSVAVLLAAITVIILFRSREAARIETLVREAAEWVRQADIQRLCNLVDDKFEENQAEEARAHIRKQIKPGAFVKLEIVSIKVDVEGDEASVRVRYTMPIPPHMLREMGMSDMPVPNRAMESTLRMRRRPEGWKVIGYDGPLQLR